MEYAGATESCGSKPQLSVSLKWFTKIKNHKIIRAWIDALGLSGWCEATQGYKVSIQWQLLLEVSSTFAVASDTAL